jgi:6-phosphofructokinase
VSRPAPGSQAGALGEREDALGGHHAVIADHDAAVVQDAAGLEDALDERPADRGVEARGLLDDRLQRGLARDRDQGSVATLRHGTRGGGQVLEHARRDASAVASEERIRTQLGDRAAQLLLEQDRDHHHHVAGGALEDVAELLELERVHQPEQADGSEGQRHQEAAHHAVPARLAHDAQEDVDRGGQQQ